MSHLNEHTKRLSDSELNGQEMETKMHRGKKKKSIKYVSMDYISCMEYVPIAGTNTKNDKSSAHKTQISPHSIVTKTQNEWYGKTESNKNQNLIC